LPHSFAALAPPSGVCLSQSVTLPRLDHGAPVREFLERLKRRKTVQWGLAYLAVAWIAFEPLDLLADRYGWSDTMVRSVGILLAFGFPLILIVAWFHGERGQQRVTLPEVALVIVVLAGAGVAVSRVEAGPGTGAPVASVAATDALPSVGRLAILPLDDLSSADGPSDFLAEGLHDEIINRVSKISAISVVSRSSVMRFTDVGARDLGSIAEMLDVGFVLEGSVRRVQDRVRVTATLVDTRADRSLWAEAYDRLFTATEILDVQTDIALQIAAALEAQLAPGERSRIERSGTTNDIAYEFFLRGRQRFSGAASANIVEAAELFIRAVEIDSTFAEAWSGLAGAQVTMGNYFLVPPEEAFAVAEASAMRALALDPGQVDAWVWLGWMHINRWEWTDLDDVLARVFRAAPFHAQALYLQAYGLQARGQFDEAVATANTGMALDPLSGAMTRAAARMRHGNREFEVAVALLQRALELDPAGTGAHFYLALSLEQLGRFPEAVNELGLAALGQGRSMDPVGELESAYADGGMAGAWRVWLGWRLEDEDPRPGPVAIGYARLGAADEAFDWLHRAEQVGESWLFQMFDPIWDPIRGDPRFDELLARLGL